jgi:hypothetical protein
MSRAATAVPTQEGVLVSSDEQSIVFLRCLNDSIAERSRRFITLMLDSRNLLIRAEHIEFVYSALQTRLQNTVWDEEGEAQQQAEDAARREKRGRK